MEPPDCCTLEGLPVCGTEEGPPVCSVLKGPSIRDKSLESPVRGAGGGGPLVWSVW